MKFVADTGPLVAAAHKRDRAHALARDLLVYSGYDVIVPVPVVSEADYLLRVRAGSYAGRALLTSLADGWHRVAFMTAGLLRRATELDSRYADLDLGFVDASVMAYAERHDLPILTFDFEHFRATAPERGEWRLVVDEADYRASLRRA